MFKKRTRRKSSEQNQPISIVLADDQGLTRAVIADVIQDQTDWVIVDAVSNGEEAIEAAKNHRPDVVLMDVAMPGMTGIEATRVMKSVCPEPIVVIVSNYDNENLIRAARDAGAAGFVAKHRMYEDLVESIRNALDR
jgi:DNA-binding NarL/FixJ family response regulator